MLDSVMNLAALTLMKGIKLMNATPLICGNSHMKYRSWICYSLKYEYHQKHLFVTSSVLSGTVIDFCLCSNKYLDEWISLLLEHRSVLVLWYDNNSCMLDPQAMEHVIRLLARLKEFPFALDLHYEVKQLSKFQLDEFKLHPQGTTQSTSSSSSSSSSTKTTRQRFEPLLELEPIDESDLVNESDALFTERTAATTTTSSPSAAGPPETAPDEQSQPVASTTTAQAVAQTNVPVYLSPEVARNKTTQPTSSSSSSSASSILPEVYELKLNEDDDSLSDEEDERDNDRSPMGSSPPPAPTGEAGDAEAEDLQSTLRLVALRGTVAKSRRRGKSTYKESSPSSSSLPSSSDGSEQPLGGARSGNSEEEAAVAERRGTLLPASMRFYAKELATSALVERDRRRRDGN